MLEQIAYLNYKVNEYKAEREKLNKQLAGTNSDKVNQVEKLENEIKGHKNMVDSCVKTCSQLAEEIMLLKSELSKYTGFDNDNDNYNDNDNIDTKGYNSFYASQKNMNMMSTIKSGGDSAPGSSIKNKTKVKGKFK